MGRHLVYPLTGTLPRPPRLSGNGHRYQQLLPSQGTFPTHSVVLAYVVWEEGKEGGRKREEGGGEKRGGGGRESGT